MNVEFPFKADGNDEKDREDNKIFHEFSSRQSELVIVYCLHYGDGSGDG